VDDKAASRLAQISEHDLIAKVGSTFAGHDLAAHFLGLQLHNQPAAGLTKHLPSEPALAEKRFPRSELADFASATCFWHPAC
jgi:hypothetical protein